MILLGIGVPGDGVADVDAKAVALRDLFEERRRQDRIWSSQSNKSGIACPDCGGELLIDNPGVTLTSYPPCQWATCEKCKQQMTIPA